MKRLIIVMVLMVLTTPAFATPKVTNVTNVSNIAVESKEQNAWDYGVSGEVVLYETANSEWGVRADHLIESGETRGYVTGKFYLNRAAYQKK